MSMPKVGDRAPEFEIPDQAGNPVSLADFRGKTVILYFYPKDDTPGCTIEACNFRDDYDDYAQAGVEILGVSPDSPRSHTRFREKFDLPFTLLADEDHRVSEAYGVWGEKKLFGRKYLGVNRSTFVIDPEGTISHVFPNVDAEGHSAELLDLLRHEIGQS